MNILFISPKPNIHFDTAHSIPLGLAYMASVLENGGHKVSVIDLNVQADTIQKEIKNVDVVGVRAITPIVKSAWNICKRVKSVNPNITTVLGGPHPSCMPEESLQKPQVDIVVRKEGEYTFKELCDKLEKGLSLDKILGISYKKGKRVIHNKDRPPIKNLDELPFPAYHLFPMEKYDPTRPTWVDKSKLRVGNIMTSRGCPFQCNFCFKGVHGYQFRYRSPENVIEEIRLLTEKYNVNFLEILDDNFTFYHERAIKICKLMIKEGIDIEWTVPEGFSRVDNLNKEILKWAKKSGCTDVWLAIESGSPRVLKEIIHKNVTLDQIRNAFKLAKEAGFITGGFVSIGNYGEQEYDIKKTIDFVLSLDMDRLQISIVTPFPGSELFNKLEKEGKLLTKDWDLYGLFEKRVYFEYGGMSKEKILELYKEFFRKFYLRPSYIMKILKNKTTYLNFPLLLKEAMNFMK